jgi:hypothetical protein
MEQICEIMLFSEGFDTSKVSARAGSKFWVSAPPCLTSSCSAYHKAAATVGSCKPCQTIQELCLPPPNGPPPPPNLPFKVLAKKMTVLYKLAAEQLSKQHHYDFGLRALKSVLVMAGTLKRDSPGMSEQLVLMRALRDMNLPKFVWDDVPMFLGLVS